MATIWQLPPQYCTVRAVVRVEVREGRGRARALRTCARALKKGELADFSYVCYAQATGDRGPATTNPSQDQE